MALSPQVLGMVSPNGTARIDLAPAAAAQDRPEYADALAFDAIDCAVALLTQMAPSGTLQAALDRGADKLASAAVVAKAIVEGRRMSKLHEAASRIAGVKAANDADGDELMAKMDEIERIRPGAKANAHAFLNDQKAELESIESTLRQLSNLPLGGSQSSAGG